MNSEELARWKKSLLWGFFVFLLFSLYLFIRRGYFNLYIANKAFGSASALLAGITLVVGPLSKKFTRLASFMTIRRQMGLVALGFAVLHVVASLYQTNRFPIFSWYIREWFPVSMGIAALAIWIYLFSISSNEKIKQMGVEKWKKYLSVGAQVAFIAIFLHLVVMKYPGWIRWWNGQVKQTPELANPTYLPASIFVFLFIVAVIVYRLINHILYKRKNRLLE